MLVFKISDKKIQIRLRFGMANLINTPLKQAKNLTHNTEF